MGWPAWWGVVILLAIILDGILISDALYQIVNGKPSFLPFERMLRKRVPATPTDGLLQGVSKLLVYIGVLLVQLPLFATSYLGPDGFWAQRAGGIAIMVCAAIALLLVVSAAIVETKVRFTYLGSAVNEP